MEKTLARRSRAGDLEAGPRYASTVSNSRVTTSFDVEDESEILRTCAVHTKSFHADKAARSGKSTNPTDDGPVDQDRTFKTICNETIFIIECKIMRGGALNFL